MSDPLPDRLCASPKSPYYDEALLERGVGILFNGATYGTINGTSATSTYSLSGLGIHFSGSSNNIISSSSATGIWAGIRLESNSNGNTITGSRAGVTSVGSPAIAIDTSQYNTISYSNSTNTGTSNS